MLVRERLQPRLPGLLRLPPGPLPAVGFGVGASTLLRRAGSALAIARQEHMVGLPVAGSPREFFQILIHPDFSRSSDTGVWIAAATLAVVAGIETVLCIEAADRLDPFRRITPNNREPIARGAGNMVSGLPGGLPMTSAVVRSSPPCGCMLAAGGQAPY